jgi:copper chaperone CopZ
MTHTYNITGMTCNGCVAKVKSELLKMGDIAEADVQLPAPQATIHMQKHIPIEALQATVLKAGNYTITEVDGSMHNASAEELSKSWVETYKPVLLILFYVSLVSIIAATSIKGIDIMLGMRIFMSGFFLTFSFFKMLDLKGFASSYSTYDVIARKFAAWGFIYPFVELLLGVAYASNFQPLITNLSAFTVMTVSIIGVLGSVLNNRKIKCACLGAVFNLPMSSVTIIEDALMIIMSGVMVGMLL